MKRTFAAIVCFVLLLSGCSGNAESHQTAAVTTVQTTIITDPTVYVTENGTKYHRETCCYLWNSRIPFTNEQAVALGFTPCSRCKH